MKNNSDSATQAKLPLSKPISFSTGRHLQHYYPLVWLLIVSLALFALLVAWDLGLVSMVIALDRSYVTSIICGLLALSSCHAAWHIFSYSQMIEGLRAAETAELSDAQIEVFAEKRRAPVDLGWFLVDLAIRLGLVGTIIGFILIFTSLSSVTIDGADGLKELMIAMSGGMGTALFTTLTGLIAGTLMSFQYLILSRQTENLIALLISPESA